MDEPWVAIQRNRKSGSGKRKREVLRLIEYLRRQGVKTRLFSNREKLDEKLEQPAVRDSLKCLVAAGGDGTFRDVVSRHSDLPLAILPLGTENLIARHYAIPKSGTDVGRMILRERTQRIDVGLINGRRFLIMVGIGFDAEIVRRAEEVRSGNITRLRYLKPILGTLWNYRYPEIRVRAEDSEDSISGGQVLVVNLNAYAYRLSMASNARNDDGLLDARVFEGKSGFKMWRYFYKVLRTKHESLSDVQSLRSEKFFIEADEPVPIQVDGDFLGFTPAEISIDPQKVTLLIPESFQSN